MNKYYISVGSVTHAMKGRNLLSSNGYRAVVKRKPQSSGREGCGYTINVENVSDIKRVIDILVLGEVRVIGYGEDRDRP